MNLVLKIKKVCLSPISFFGKLKEKGYRAALIYFAVLYAFYVVLLTLMKTSAGQTAIVFLPSEPSKASLSILGMIFIYLSGFVLTFFVNAGVLHISIKLFGGKAKYDKTCQIVVYSNTPTMVLGWIPFLGFVASAYNLFLLAVGVRKVYKLSVLRSVLCIAFAFVVIAIFVSSALTFLDLVSMPGAL